MTRRKRKNMSWAKTKNNDQSKVDNDQSVDFLSSLPDNVLTKIFYLLTMREAFNTCISCRKLTHLMKSIPNIEFKEVNEEGCLIKSRKFIKSVSRFLENHDGVVQKFQLSYNPGGYLNDILRWLCLVVKEGIEEIDLTIDDETLYPDIYVWSLRVGTLKVLKLRHCTVANLSPITGLKSLKSLLLGDMYISDEDLELLCCHCESLQHLTLENCIGFEDIEIVNPRSKLETLVLDGPYRTPLWLNISKLKNLVICTRKMNFSFIGCPHIDDLVLCRAAPEITQEESENMKVNIINKLSNVKSLRLAGRAFECFSASRSIEIHQMTNLEVLDLDFPVCLYNQKELNNLISHSQSLKTLHISSKQKYYSRDSSVYTDCSIERVFANLMDIKYEVVSSNTLQNVDIKDFSGTIYEVSYIKFVLAHFQQLRVIKVTPVEEMDGKKSRAYAKLFSRFPRVSTDVYMLMGSEEVWKPEEA